jgi:hypothetical protein
MLVAQSRLKRRMAEAEPARMPEIVARMSQRVE